MKVPRKTNPIGTKVMVRTMTRTRMKAGHFHRPSGIGRALARALVAKGADVLVVGRTFRDHHLSGLHFLQVDLSSLKSSRTVAQQLPAETLDLLVLTHGIFAGRQRQTNVEGIELDMAVSGVMRAKERGRRVLQGTQRRQLQASRL